MSEPIRAEGQFVTATAKPGMEATQAQVEAIAAMGDEMVDRTLDLTAAIDAFAAIYGERMLLAVLGPLVDEMRSRKPITYRMKPVLIEERMLSEPLFPADAELKADIEQADEHLRAFMPRHGGIG